MHVGATGTLRRAAMRDLNDSMNLSLGAVGTAASVSSLALGTATAVGVGQVAELSWPAAAVTGLVAAGAIAGGSALVRSARTNLGGGRSIETPDMPEKTVREILTRYREYTSEDRPSAAAELWLGRPAPRVRVRLVDNPLRGEVAAEELGTGAEVKLEIGLEAISLRRDQVVRIRSGVIRRVEEERVTIAAEVVPATH